MPSASAAIQATSSRLGQLARVVLEEAQEPPAGELEGQRVEVADVATMGAGWPATTGSSSAPSTAAGAVSITTTGKPEASCAVAGQRSQPGHVGGDGVGGERKGAQTAAARRRSAR